MRSSSGGGQTSFHGARTLDPADVSVPDGYVIEVIADSLTFPTGVAFDASGRPHVVEAGYSYGEAFTIPRLLRIEDDGSATEVARGDNGPWNGVVFHDGSFYVAGGHAEGGRILEITSEGDVNPILSNLPSYGDHHTNGPVVGSDGRLYFGQGTATNSGVVGIDNLHFGWLPRNPDFHDIPCEDIRLRGTNFETEHPLVEDPDARATTGAFSPFGQPTESGEVVPGQVPCSGAVMRLDLASEHPQPEVVAWGFRNPFGLAFAPDGSLWVTDNGYDERGSRPAWGTGDLLWRVEEGTWYGWPDFAGGVPMTDGRFGAPGQEPPDFLLAEHPGEPPHPAAGLGVHSSSNSFDFSRSDAFGFAGQAFIAQFGDMAPEAGKVLAPVGFRVIRVDIDDGSIHGFVENRHENAPASRIGSGGIERPVAARFDPSGSMLYIVDFGVMVVGDAGPSPRPFTGVLWRVRPAEDVRP